ncbi:hypothetical protein M3M35_04990 [Fructilactobacillus myrtifloralis]|uniref:Lipoprotein n=1 Tax=Fructilactobacillus myrtifloralis TaxID=2940301 RepID=A0ABY5BM76_9LACO|nr:hypothetical protein [Fructilactobacillus myrtifloralis]USS84665.1 hypothetical protein M3M35_04990 [Fructilactobacillus myrtifloralis]
MKKSLITLGACLTLAFTLAACGSHSTESKDHQAPKSSQHEKAKKKAKKTTSKKQEQPAEQSNADTQSNSATGTKNTNQSNSNQQATAQPATQATQSQPNQNSSQSNTYYQGNQPVNLPTTDGVSNVTDYWPTTMTINGTKQSVIAGYTRMGYFQIYTKQPTDQDYSFTYNGEDYQKYIGASDLDQIRQ